MDHNITAVTATISHNYITILTLNSSLTPIKRTIISRTCSRRSKKGSEQISTGSMWAVQFLINVSLRKFMKTLAALQREHTHLCSTCL